MKKTLIALFALAACAQAVETTTTTYTPLNTTEGWVPGTRTDYSRPVATIDAPAHSLAFSYNLATNGTLDAAVTLTLIDSAADKVVCVGMGKYSAGHGAVQYGTGALVTNNTYNFEQLTATVR